MAFHLEGPWLSTTGKRKGKQKFRSSEEAKKHRELEESWQRMKAKWAIDEEEKKKKRALNSGNISYSLGPPPGRETKKIPSLNNGADHSPAYKKPVPIYTGTKIKGIGIMHKSNLVPIYSDEEAVEISRMRR